jgi:competence protein ComEA
MRAAERERLLFTTSLRTSILELMDFSGKLAITLKQYMIPILLGGVGVVLLLYGLIQYVMPQSTKSDISFEAHSEGSAQAAGDEASKEKLEQITVDIEGAVLKPGVYKLPKDARVHDALIKAGGMSGKADRVQVAKALNLASKVIDGGKIYIPFEGDSVSISQTGSPLRQGSEGQAGQSVMGDTATSLININSASSTELDTLPGVGPATSEKIINNRPYEKIEDLITKKAVGQSVFEKIKDKISVY